MKRSYRRHLPHQIPEGVPLFITWNLKGSLPAEALQRLQGERERLERQPAPPDESPPERKVRVNKILFAIADKYLDAATSGPLHLKEERAAKIVEDAILFGVPTRYELFAWCVMGNHVHVLLKPLRELGKVTQGIKGHTAHEINGLENERGRVFWQDESYDHWPRDEEEFFRIIQYIENNPVAAGLCARPEDWRWSSARRRAHWPVGQAFQPDGVRAEAGNPPE